MLIWYTSAYFPFSGINYVNVESATSASLPSATGRLGGDVGGRGGGGESPRRPEIEPELPKGELANCHLLLSLLAPYTKLTTFRCCVTPAYIPFAGLARDAFVRSTNSDCGRATCHCSWSLSLRTI